VKEPWLALLAIVGNRRRQAKLIRYIKGTSHFVTSMTAPIASGWSESRLDLSPTGKTPPLHGARQQLPFPDE